MSLNSQTVREDGALRGRNLSARMVHERRGWASQFQHLASFG